MAAAIVGLLGVAALVRAYWKLLTSASPEVGAAIVSASALILVALAGAILNSYFARRQQIEQELRQRKAEVYTEFLEYWFWAMRDRSKVSEEEKEKREYEYRSTVPQQLVVWGSEPFIKELGAWLGGKERDGTMLDFVNLLRTIRADLGYKDRDLKREDLMMLFLKPDSVERYMQQRRAPDSEDGG